MKPAPAEDARRGLQAFIRAQGPADAVLEEVASLRSEESDGFKALGYGAPVRVRFRSADGAQSWVVRTANADGFGHEHPADRWASLVLARDTFGRLPRHVRPRALGVLRPSGQRVTVPDGTPFLVTEYVEGQPYARDLERAAATDRVTPRDLERAERLAQLLADTHAERVDPVLYRRALRDLVGHGEGIFGLTESYDPHDPVAPRPRLQALELNAVRWRWRLLERTERARRTHGDFHPFNVLFDDSNAVHLLDASRGGAGEPADDLCALSINYLFFALRERGRFCGALRTVWDRFWCTYLRASGDGDVLQVVAPFFAWRALVLASPAWYPTETAATRNALLSFGERLLNGARFDPSRVEEVLA